MASESAAGSRREPAPYMNPYLAGIGLGLVLLAAFVVMGRGLGASGAISSVAAVTVDTVASEHARGNPFWMGYLEGEGSPLKTFLVFEVIGMLVGGFISGALAGRVRSTVEKGPRIEYVRCHKCFRRIRKEHAIQRMRGTFCSGCSTG